MVRLTLQEKLINQRCFDQRAPSHNVPAGQSRRMPAERLPIKNTSSIQTVELPPDNDSSETKFPQADRALGRFRRFIAEACRAAAAVLTGMACLGRLPAMDGDVCPWSFQYAADRGEGAVGNCRRRECDGRQEWAGFSAG